jgi:ABC-type glucose/galactose transport system permease subunit
LKRLLDRPIVVAIVVLLAVNLLNLGLLRAFPALTPFSWGFGAILIIYGAFSSQAGGVRSETITRGYTGGSQNHAKRLGHERRAREMTGLYLALLGSSLLLSNWLL